MATRSLMRPLRPSIIPNTTPYVCPSCESRRWESTFRRTRKALRSKLEESFLPSRTETREHIIFNPPSSAPNVYHTPQKFLPQADPRSKLHSSASSPLAASVSSQLPEARRATAVRAQYDKKYHLNESQIEEIRSLRAEDPRKWTRVKLAEKFECSQFFISLCCCAPEVKKEQDETLAEIKRRWGRKKTEAREDRQTRKALWGRDA